MPSKSSDSLPSSGLEVVPEAAAAFATALSIVAPAAALPLALAQGAWKVANLVSDHIQETELVLEDEKSTCSRRVSMSSTSKDSMQRIRDTEVVLYQATGHLREISAQLSVVADKEPTLQCARLPCDICKTRLVSNIKSTGSCLHNCFCSVCLPLQKAAPKGTYLCSRCGQSL